MSLVGSPRRLAYVGRKHIQWKRECCGRQRIWSMESTKVRGGYDTSSIWHMSPGRLEIHLNPRQRYLTTKQHQDRACDEHFL
jgi:hypothetical protein